MAPNVYASSTIGVKKSTVCTRAHSGESLYTPASSAVSNPTSTFSFAQRGIRASTWSKTFGLSLDAQPAAEDWAVRRFLVGTTLEYKEYEGDKEYQECTQLFAAPSEELSGSVSLAKGTCVSAGCLSDNSMFSQAGDLRALLADATRGSVRSG